jgi:exodeoxyribonuclease VII small subunit
MKQRDPSQLSFEDAFAQLEEVLAKLEAGNLPLEQAVALYEEGMRLARLCQERLEQAELRIRQLQGTFDYGASQPNEGRRAPKMLGELQEELFRE